MGNPAQERQQANRDDTDLGDVLNDVPQGSMLDQALKDPARRPAILRRLKQRQEQARAAAAAKAKAAAGVGGAPEKVDTPEAPVVDGVPTGSTVHYDDDSAVEMETTEKKHGMTTTTKTEGDHKEVHQHGVKAGYADGKVGVDKVSNKETAVGDASTKVERSGGVGVGKEGAEIRGKHVTTGKVGENSESTATGGNIGVAKDGTVSGGGSRTHVTETATGKTEKATTGSINSKGEINVGHSSKTEQKHGNDADGNPIVSSKATEVKGHLGPNGAGGEIARNTTSATGTQKSATAGADIDWKEGSASVHGGYSVMTKSGNSVKMSVSAGIKVHADEPVQVGNHWEVTYVVTKTAGGSFGAGTTQGGIGFSAGVGASETGFQSGTKIFKTKDEAVKFQGDAAHKIGDVYPPTTVAGALTIPIGESRGLGSSTAVEASGAISFEGASLGASAHKSNSEELGIKRISERLVDVTDTRAGEHGHDFSVSGGITNTKGSSQNKYASVTWRFDVTTGEGQAAFMKFCQDRLPPVKGARRVRIEAGEGKEDHDKVHVPVLGDANWHSGTSESVTQDDQGEHKKFVGEKGHDQTPGWVAKHIFGDDEQHSTASLTSRQENGKEAGYQVQVKVSGESGKYNREHLGNIFTGAKTDGPVKASGEWTLSANIDKKTMQELEKNSSRFKGAKTQDEKMRILSEIMAENGEGAAWGMVSAQGKKMAWDLELKGDKNFPGPTGRERLELLHKTMTRQLAQDPLAALSAVNVAQTTLDELKERRAAVADKSKYTDLPDGLRQEQLDLIDYHVHAFEMLRHDGLVLLIKNKPDEPIEKIRQREGDAHGYDKVKPEERQLTMMRDWIADKEYDIAKYLRDIREAVVAIRQAERHIVAGKGSRLVAPKWKDYQDSWSMFDKLDERQPAINAKAEELRLKFLDPAHRQETAHALVEVLEEKRQLEHTELITLQMSASALKSITTPNGVKGHEAFWDTISGGVGDVGDDE